jgi:hypothetical protein
LFGCRGTAAASVQLPVNCNLNQVQASIAWNWVWTIIRMD